MFYYLNVYCIEYIFRIYILLYIKKHYFIHCCLFLKSSKAFSVSLNEMNANEVAFAGDFSVASGLNRDKLTAIGPDTVISLNL